ncbi:MAG: hypothetical protein PHF21_02220 [Bacilli bacterium]|nr:hypothetical protein [Bacilli bacterium]
MNIIITNQNYKITESLNVEVIKTLSGEFSLDEVSNHLVNFFYNKLIIDITAIRNYYDINSTINFLRGFDSDKIIILLNDSEVINNNSFLGRLVENGFYNFTRNAAGVNYLIDNPNNYEDVVQYTKELPNYSNNNYNINNTIKEDFSSISDAPSKNKKNTKQIIIGVQNLTDHAGATTLSYMMYKQLKYNYTVKAIEMNKQDFIYYRNSDLTMCTSIDSLKLKLKEFSNVEVIIIDLNGFDAEALCDDILYLVDPGTIRLNLLLNKDSNAFMKTRNGKVILNRSAIKQEEITNFEYETKSKVFFNITNFDDRKDRIRIIDLLLYNLGFKKQNPHNLGFFGNIFQKNQ